jgi:inhibitor of KinA sporulation pathway (predicted exonuclease)
MRQTDMGAERDRFLEFLLTGRFGEFVLYDLEFTAWPGSRQSNWAAPGEHREIVQIGAVRVAPARGCAEIGCFERIVRPRINPSLSPYLIELTGLSQERVDREGLKFEQAMEDFRAFAGDTSTLMAAFGADAEVMNENCALNRCATALLPAQMVDIRPFILRALSLEGQSVSSGELPHRLGYPPAGHAHDALADARALAIALRHIQSKRRAGGEAEAGAEDWYLWG